MACRLLLFWLIKNFVLLSPFMIFVILCSVLSHCYVATTLRNTSLFWIKEFNFKFIFPLEYWVKGSEYQFSFIQRAGICIMYNLYLNKAKFTTLTPVGNFLKHPVNVFEETVVSGVSYMVTSSKIAGCVSNHNVSMPIVTKNWAHRNRASVCINKTTSTSIWYSHVWNALVKKLKST